MRAFAVGIVIASFTLGCVAGEPPPPQKPYHLLLGPYEYELSRKQMAEVLAFDATRYKSFAAMKAAMAALPHGKRVPRYYTLDDKHYTTIDALKAAITALPAGANVYLRGDCTPETAVDLPPRPVTLSALRSYCSGHGITFTWTFGPGGY